MNFVGIKTVLCVGTLIRLFLIIYGDWQDRTQLVKYTDVDYYVFTDAAEFMLEGKSPYLRPTYRYTPLLAWILQPNILISDIFGKLLFVCCDIITGYLIYKLCQAQNIEDNTAIVCSSLWLLNPIPATVSSRGNAESIMAALVLLALKLLQEGKIAMAAFVYAVSVHMKIYPAVYALQIYLYLGPPDKSIKEPFTLLKEFWPNRNRLKFIIIAGTTFFCLTGIFYYWYGWDFLHQTYLYHLTRRDIRHNFSVYFYMLYLTALSPHTKVLGLLAFLPQLLLLVTFSMKYKKDPAICWLLNTFVFVTFNKVCTSQYFLWYLSILPVVIPQLHISKSMTIISGCSWISSQGLWLLFAYLLEFEGQPTFLVIWSAGILFFLVNIWIMTVIIDSYKPNISCTKKLQ